MSESARTAASESERVAASESERVANSGKHSRMHLSTGTRNRSRSASGSRRCGVGGGGARHLRRPPAPPTANHQHVLRSTQEKQIKSKSKFGLVMTH